MQVSEQVKTQTGPGGQRAPARGPERWSAAGAQLLDARVHVSHRIGLPEKRVRRLVRRSEEHDAARVLRHPLQGRRDSGGRGGPDEEDCLDAIEAGIQRLGSSEISAHHLDLWRQISGLRIAHHGADVRASG